MPSITESGRARYTYSNMQGCNAGLSAHCWLCNWPAMSMNSASPGATSRTVVWPVPSSATVSLASITFLPPPSAAERCDWP